APLYHLCAEVSGSDPAPTQSARSGCWRLLSRSRAGSATSSWVRVPSRLVNAATNGNRLSTPYCLAGGTRDGPSRLPRDIEMRSLSAERTERGVPHSRQQP